MSIVKQSKYIGNDIYRDVYESQVGNTDLDVEGGEL